MTRSAVSATTPMSWVISTSAMPLLALQLAISRSRICAWMVTSSAVVGSSAISSFGLQAMRHRDHHALAHAAGELVREGVAARRSGSGMPTCSQQLDDARAALGASEPRMRLQRLADLEADGEARVERRHRLLEDHRDVLADDAGGARAALIDSRSRPSKRMRSARDRSRSAAAGPSPPASPPTCRSRIRRRSPSTSPAIDVRSNAVDRA